MNREKVLKTIKYFKLDPLHIARMANVSQTSAYFYIKDPSRISLGQAKKLEQTVVNYRDKVFENRLRLLQKTPYSQFYARPVDELIV